jgi:hypothetical protein
VPAAPTRLELEAPSALLAERAASELGLTGTVLPPMTLLGRKVAVVAELIPDAHAERLAHGHTPMTDRATVATWVWPELAEHIPAQAVRTTGVIAVTRHWRTALAAVAPFARFTRTAVVVPSAAIGTRDYWVNCVFRARELGVVIMAAGKTGVVEIVQSAEAAIRSAPMTAAMRVANEVIYQRLTLPCPRS